MTPNHLVLLAALLIAVLFHALWKIGSIATNRRELVAKNLELLLATFTILVGAMLVSIQFRVQLLPFGETLGEDYTLHSTSLLIVMVFALLFAFLLSVIAGRLPGVKRLLSTDRPFRVMLVAVAVTCGLALYFMPQISQLQLIYFAVIAVGLGLLVIVVPNRLRPIAHEDWIELWQRRELLFIWLRYTIKARYTQTVLGILWIVLLPLSLSLVMAFAFGQILQAKGPGVPYVAFILAGIVSFSFFQEGVQNSTSAVASQIQLIGRVYFPREILILLSIGEGLVDMVFKLIVLIAVNLFVGIFPNWVLVYLPIPLIILTVLTLGLMFFVSVWSMLIRDVPQLVGVILRLLFYISPIIYSLENVPERWQFLVAINPLTLVIQAFRDIVVFGKPPDMVSLYYPMVISLALTYAGYAYFKSKQGVLSDLV
jgi:lipopolysaccharide transport system permease protein